MCDISDKLYAFAYYKTHCAIDMQFTYKLCNA